MPAPEGAGSYNQHTPSTTPRADRLMSVAARGVRWGTVIALRVLIL